MRRKSFFKRLVAFALAFVLAFNVSPMGTFAETTEPYDGMEVTVELGNGQPENIEGYVWVADTKSECKDALLHSHTEDCYVLNCYHKNGHIDECYSKSITYSECTHNDNSNHTGFVTIQDVVEYKVEYTTFLGQSIPSGITMTWKDHPASDVVKQKYTELGGNGDLASQIYAMYEIYETKFCFTETSTPDNCEHAEHREDCYGFKSILDGGCGGRSHEHTIDCQYEKYILYADVNNNGTPDKDDSSYTISYVNDDGTSLQSSDHLEGTVYPGYTGSTPTKAADAEFTYEFSGWNPVIPTEGTKVTEAVTHKAQYNSTKNKYEITWKSENGETLGSDEVEYGEMPEYNGETPVKEAEGKVYTFAGWSPEVTEVTGKAEYTATFTEKNVYEVKYTVGENTVTKYVVEGEKAESYAPERTYYILSSWYSDDSYTSKFDFDTTFNDEVGNIALYAKWIPVNDINKDNIADEEQVCGISVTGNVTAEVSGNKIPGETVTVTATPKDGKFITGAIKVNDALYETNVTYKDTKATFNYTLPTGDAADYIIEIETADVGISLYSEYINWNELLTDEETKILLFENVNWGAMPETVAEKTKVEYLEYDVVLYKSWKEIGGDVTPLIGHTFGANAGETIRFIFEGNDQIPAFTKEFEVSLTDNRLPSKIKVEENVTFTYSPSVTAEEMAKLIFDEAFICAASEDGTVELSAEYGKNVFVDNVYVDAGAYTAVVNFYGTKEYAASSAEVTVTIEKADATVTMTSNNVVLYQNVSALTKNNLMSVTSNTEVADKVEHLYFVMGLDANLNDPANPAIFAEVDLSQTSLNVDVVVPGVIDTNLADEIVELLGGEDGLTLDELLNSTEGLKELLRSLGLDINILEQYIDADMLKEALSVLYGVLEEYEEYGDVYVKFTNNEQANPQLIDSHGVYLVGAVTTDANYNTAYNATVIAVTAEPVEVVFEDVNENSARLFTYDGKPHAMTAKAYDSEGNELTTPAMQYVYVGVESDGEPYYGETAPTETGSYTVTAFYCSEDKGMAGASVAVMIIQPAKAAVAVEDFVVIPYTEAPIDIRKEMITVSEGINGDEVKIAVLTGSISVDGDFSEEGLDSVVGNLNIDLPQRADEVIETLLGKNLQTANVKVEDFQRWITELKEKLDAVEEIELDTAALDEILVMLADMPNVTSITFEDDVKPSEIGAYFVGAVVFDPNYTPEIGAGILLITPEVETDELSWNYDDENGIITLPALEAQENLLAATAANGSDIKYFIIGTDENGNEVRIHTADISYDSLAAKGFGNGVYTQVAYIPIEVSGSFTVGYPIVRSFVVTPQCVSVDFEPDLNIENAVEFKYTGNPIEAPTVVTYMDGAEVPKEKLDKYYTVTYVGVDSTGTEYNSVDAPTNVGIYTVTAYYEEHDAEGELLYAGLNLGLMAITPADAGVTIDDIYVCCDCGCECTNDTVDSKCKDCELKDYTIDASTANDELETMIIIDDGNGNINVLVSENWNLTVNNEANDVLEDLIEQIIKLSGLADNNVISETLEAVIEEIQNLKDADTAYNEAEVDAIIEDLLQTLNELNSEKVKDMVLALAEEVKGIAGIDAATVNEIIVALNAIEDAETEEDAKAAAENVIALIEKISGEEVDEVAKLALAAVAVQIKAMDFSDMSTAVKSKATTMINAVIAELEALKEADIAGTADSKLAEMILKLKNLKSEIVEEEAEIYGALTELRTELEKVKSELRKVESLNVNGELPSECGVYDVTAIAFGTNYKVSVDTAALTIAGHVWGDWYVTKQPTVDAEGEERRDCANCGEYQIRKINKLPSGSSSDDSNKDESSESSKKPVEVYYAESSTKTTATVNTGDSANVVVYVALITIAGIALVILYYKKRRV